jgi:hypothetical protein
MQIALNYKVMAGMAKTVIMLLTRFAESLINIHVVLRFKIKLMEMQRFFEPVL